MKLFIANVPHKLEEAKLNTMLTQFGQMASVKLVTDMDTGKRKGWGFIEMPVNDQAKAAIAALDGKEVCGEIALSEAVDKGKEERKDFQRPRREYKGHGGDSTREIDGNKW